MHDRRIIRGKALEGMPIRQIARELGISRNAVRRALDPSRPDRYLRPNMAPLDALEPDIRSVLSRYPRMPAAGIARRLRYTGQLRPFTDRVHRIRREVLDAAAREPGPGHQGDLGRGRRSPA